MSHLRRKRQVPFLALMCVVNLFVQVQQARCQSTFSADSVRYELALTLKTAGDQSFLHNDRDKAQKLYATAFEQASLIPPDSKDVNSTLLLLLKIEIKYRESLLLHGLEFWGSTYSQTPAIPVQQFQYLGSYFKAFDKSLAQMHNDLKDASTAKTTIQSFDALAEGTNTSADVAALQEGKANLAADYYDGQLGLLQDRISQDFDRQKEIGHQTQSLINQEAAKRQAIDSLIAKSLTSSMGLPVDVSALAGKPLDQQILSIGSQLISSNDSQLLSSISGFSDTSATLLKYYQGAQSLVNEVKGDAETAQHLGLLLRNPSLDKLESLGGTIFSHLDADSQNQWKTLVAQSKSFSSLLQLSQSAAPVRDALATYLSKQNDLNDYLSPIFDAFSKTSNEELQQIQQGILKSARAIQLPQQDSKALFEFVATSYTNQVCSLLPAPTVTAILKTSSLASVEDLHARLISKGISVLGNLTVDGNIIVLSVAGGAPVKIDLGQILEQVQSVPGGLEKTQVSMVYQRLITQLNSSTSVLSEAVTKQLLASPYSPLLMKYVSSAGAPVGQDRLYKEVVDRLSSGDQNSTFDRLAHIAVGADFRQKSSYVPTMHPQDAVANQGTTNSALMTNAAMALLGAAVPEAAVAQAVVTMLSDLSELAGISEQINRLYQEDKQIEKEQLELQGMVREARFAHETAVMDKRIAEASFHGAVVQGDIYKQALRDQATDQLESVVRAKLLLPGLVFKAELLRRSFDSLERSLALWIGDPRQTHGFLESYVRSNPQYLQFILDEDIHLYDWLDRSVEGTHIDFDTLSAHWDQLIQLSTEVCQQNGCDTGVFGSVSQTAILSLQKLIPKNQWDKFTQWKQSQSSAPFTFSFMLDPSQHLVDPTLNNVRVIDVHLAGVRGSNRVSLTQTRLEHSGISYIPQSGSFFREVFQPDTAIDLTWSSDSFDIETLRLRWTHANGRKSLEGYGLYTLWSLTLLPTADNQLIDDIALRFAFQFKPPTGNVTPSASDPNRKLRVYTGADTYFEFTAGDLGLLGDPEQLAADMAVWQKEAETARRDLSAPLAFSRAELIKQ